MGEGGIKGFLVSNFKFKNAPRGAFLL